MLNLVLTFLFNAFKFVFRFVFLLFFCLQAAILQHTAEYIYQLEQEKTRLLQEMCQFKRMFNSSQGSETDGSPQSLPPLKKIKIEPSRTSESTNSESSDEGIQCQPSSKTAVVTSGNESDPVDEMRTDLIEVRKVLDRERRLRMQLEDQVRSLEAQLYPERIKEIAQQVQLQFNEVSDRD
jgi:transcription factor AP-4